MTTLTVMTAEEWDAAKQAALNKLGCTYDELEDMARRRDYATLEHRKLWVVIGRSLG